MHLNLPADEPSGPPPNELMSGPSGGRWYKEITVAAGVELLGHWVAAVVV